MSLVHLLYIGHFEADGQTARRAPHPGSPVLHPVARKPLDWAVVNELSRTGGRLADMGALSRDGDYLVGDLYAMDSVTVAFIRRLVERTGCKLVERGLIVEPQHVLPRP